MNEFTIALFSIIKILSRINFIHISILSLVIGLYEGKNDSNLFPNAILFTIAGTVIIIINVYIIPAIQKVNSNATIQKHNSDYDNAFFEQKNEFQSRSIEPLFFSNNQWKTKQGEIVRFRGINLPAKTPSKPIELKNTKNCKNLYSSKAKVSFVDRPIPLDSAHEHFQRLSSFGFNLVRLSVVWEACMHEAPGVIDQEYMNYLSKLVDVAATYGIYVIIDPHQDVWSRFTGGDGAPWWTLDKVGFRTDSNVIHETGGAMLHSFAKSNDKNDYNNGKQKANVSSLWGTNYGRLVPATMFTLFFGGDTFAPDFFVEDCGEKKSIQSFLQDYYLEFMDAVALCLKDKTNVLGFFTMNEANKGFIGMPDLNSSLLSFFYLGHVMSAFEGMRLGSGESFSIPYFSSLYLFDSKVLMNKNKLSVWKTPSHDVWLNAGVYEIDPNTQQRKLKSPHYFRTQTDHMETTMLPFYEKIAKTVRKHNDTFIIYAEPHIAIDDFYPKAPKTLNSNIFAWSPHWYDIGTLSTKMFSKWWAISTNLIPAFTPYFIQKSFNGMLRDVKGAACGKHHVLLGEIGVPFNMNSRKSIDTNVYTDPIAALERSLRAVEANDMDYTMWCYVHDNNHKDGDLWNEENLSIRAENKNRALQSVIRPYVFKLGNDNCEIMEQQFDSYKKMYTLKLRMNCNEYGQQRVFIPSYHYSFPIIIVSDGEVQYDKNGQVALWKNISCSRNSIISFTLQEGKHKN